MLRELYVMVDVSLFFGEKEWLKENNRGVGGGAREPRWQMPRLVKKSKVYLPVIVFKFSILAGVSGEKSSLSLAVANQLVNLNARQQQRVGMEAHLLHLCHAATTKTKDVKQDSKAPTTGSSRWRS